jgi:hypothetical protein
MEEDEFEYKMSIFGIDGVERKIYKHKTDPYEFRVGLPGFSSWNEYFQDMIDKGQVGKK